ncbi:MAG: TetR/AcrR family transcriptional regulator [Acidobacteriia bacterium]|nr:TetR/AcrR family transcriptional regulator [Terriglobia bacterium]
MQERRARQKKGVREEILDAARTLFVKEGFESASIRKIAEKIEYSPGTIYLYFRDKSEILESICEETFSRLARKLEGINQDPSPPLDRLRRGLRVYVDFAVENPHHYIVTFVQGHPEIVGANSIYCSAGGNCFNSLRTGVGRCVEAGLLNSQDVDEAAQALWAGIHGISSLLVTHPGFPFVEPNRLIDRVVDILIEGIRKR